MGFVFDSPRVKVVWLLETAIQ